MLEVKRKAKQDLVELESELMGVILSMEAQMSVADKAQSVDNLATFSSMGEKMPCIFTGIGDNSLVDSNPPGALGEEKAATRTYEVLRPAAQRLTSLSKIINCKKSILEESTRPSPSNKDFKARAEKTKKEAIERSAEAKRALEQTLLERLRKCVDIKDEDLAGEIAGLASSVAFDSSEQTVMRYAPPEQQAAEDAHLKQELANCKKVHEELKEAWKVTEKKNLTFEKEIETCKKKLSLMRRALQEKDSELMHAHEKIELLEAIDSAVSLLENKVHVNACGMCKGVHLVILCT